MRSSAISYPLRIIREWLVTAHRENKTTTACTYQIEIGLHSRRPRTEANPIRISGWFFDATGKPAKVVYVRVGKHKVPCLAVKRADVFARFKDEGRELTSSNLGFVTELKTGVGLKRLVIEALCYDGVIVKLRSRLRWMRPYQPDLTSMHMPGDDDTISVAPDDTPAPQPDVKAIAFYLPQYHRIKENDAWWGEGFTEWTNVRSARPQFTGHHQPHVPHEKVGYYDLNDAQVLEWQASLARGAGIYGFCYYYYWFGGKRLLEMPLERLLASGKPDMPFCYCWANENWSRRWDGQDAEILIAQRHSTKDDAAVIHDLMRAFQDPRYIKVNCRPILIIYRPQLLPDARATFDLWRRLCLEAGIGELYLMGVKGHGCQDASKLGLDGLIEFPPNDHSASKPTDIPANIVSGFAGSLYDYREVRHRSLLAGRPEHPFYRGVMPSWDNTARRKSKGKVFLHSSPGAYRNWLRITAARTRAEPDPENRLLFINAWNEWAEGCHLEPDEKYGYAWLNATRQVLGSWTFNTSAPSRQKTPHKTGGGANSPEGVLVLIPHASNAPESRLRRARLLASRALDGLSKSRVVFDASGQAPPRGSHAARQSALASIRQNMVNRHLRNEKWIFWVDDDIVDYPANLVSELILRSAEGVAAPIVLMEGNEHDDAVYPSGFGPGRFFDIAGFIEKGRWARFTKPWFDQPGPCIELDSVGSCYIVPADLYRQGARHEIDPRAALFLEKRRNWPADAVAKGQSGKALAYTEHYSVCAFARASGLPVRAFTDLIALHQRV
jgi:hypothetical protein